MLYARCASQFAGRTVKANGYGLGTVQFARELVDNGIALLAAARPEEAAAPTALSIRRFTAIS